MTNTDRYKARVLDIICQLTAMYRNRCSEYIFMANEKHKNLKDALNEIESTKDYIDVDKLDSSLLELEEYLYVDMREFLRTTLEEYIYPLLNDRSDINPRTTIKVILDDQIVSLYRFPIDSTYEQYAHDSINIEDFSPFKQLFSEPLKKCIFNNIPENILDGDYVSTRINADRVKNYRSQQSKGYDREWADCWEKVLCLDGKLTDPPLSSCYKSTMIVPINISIDTMGNDFKEHLQLLNNKLIGNQDWAFLGFLCFDHPNTNYFDADVDYTIASIISNLLSPYLMQHFTHTQYSSTYGKATILLDSIRGKRQ